MSRTGPKNPHRSGRAREPRPFTETWASPSDPKPDELDQRLVASTRAEALRRQEALNARNRAADAAWDKELEPARLPLNHPDRVPYPQAVKAALVAYDAVIALHR